MKITFKEFVQAMEESCQADIDAKEKDLRIDKERLKYIRSFKDDLDP